MLRGVSISTLLHAGLLAWALVSFQSQPPLPADETTPISVAIISPSELTRLKQGDPDAKELEAKAKDEPKPDISKTEAEKPKPITAPPPPSAEPPPPPPEPEPPKPAEPAKADPPPEPKKDPIAEKLAALPPPEPAPGPTPEELKKIEEDKQAEEAKKAEDAKRAEEQRLADEKRKADEKKKADDKKKAEEKKKKDEQKKLAEAKRKADAAKKQKFDADRIAALLDKTPEKRGAPKSSTDPATDTDYSGPTAGERDGTDSVLSAREIDLLKGAISAQLRNCWNLPGGGGGIETMVVTLRWRLKMDGLLDGEPEIEQPQSGPVFQIAAEAAVRAVKRCQPFDLPPDKYNAWRSITWDFDPRQML